MMICRDIRHRWLQYGEHRIQAYKECLFLGRHGEKLWTCKHCDEVFRDKKYLQVDHIEPVGTRAYTWEDIGPYAEKMFKSKCQGLCGKCHKIKTDKERNRRKKNVEQT